MVSLRKIGAIASGALFLGATFGTAIAVTVPAAFQKTMLADAGVAKAQLVVGANAPDEGAPDTVSAGVIQNAVKTKLAVTGASGDIKLSYYSDDLDHDDVSTMNDDNFTTVSVTTGAAASTQSDRHYIGNLSDTYVGVNSTGGLKFDENEDNDLKDADDYTLYTGMYIADGVSSAQVRLAYYSSNITDMIGTRQKIKGSWWLVTEADPSSDFIKMGPAIYKNLALQSEALTTKATTVTGNVKLIYWNSSGTPTLSVYSGDSQEGSVAISAANENGGQACAYVGNGSGVASTGTGGAARFCSDGTLVTFLSTKVPAGKMSTKVHDVSDVLDDYEVFLTQGNATTSSIEVTVTESSQVSKIQNKQENVFGYAKAYIGDGDLITGTDSDAMFLMGDLYTLSTEQDADVQGTYFNLKFRTGKTIDLRRAASVTTTSGAKLDKSWSDYSPFLRVDIWPTALAGNKIQIKYMDDDLHDGETSVSLAQRVQGNYFATVNAGNGTGNAVLFNAQNTSAITSNIRNATGVGGINGGFVAMTLANASGTLSFLPTQTSGQYRGYVTVTSINVTNSTDSLNISAFPGVLNGTVDKDGIFSGTLAVNASGLVANGTSGSNTIITTYGISVGLSANVIGDAGNKYAIGSISDRYVHVVGGLRVDQNEDGDIKDADDYARYTGLYIQDGVSDGMIKPAYYRTNVTDLIGTRQKINGEWYLVTEADPSSDYIKMGPAIYKNLAVQTEALKTKATTFVGDAMMLLLNGTGTTRYLVVYKGDSQESSIALNTANEANGVARAHSWTNDLYGSTEAYGGTFTDSKTPQGKISSEVHDVTNAFDDYEVFLTKGNETSDSVEVTITDTSQISKIQNKQENVLGYAKAYVGDGDLIAGGDNDALILMGDLYTIAKDKDKNIEGTYFNAKFRNDKTIDVRRADTVSVVSGETMDASLSDYSPFLTVDTKATSSGGEAAEPVLDIVNETAAKKTTMNLALVGGPVANTLTAELVTGGKSVTAWDASAGDIEVVSDAFATGKYAIIVAGKNREATADAADALADAL